MAVLASILPIFIVMALGYLGAKRGFFPEAFLETANQIAYYLAIPVLIFRSVAISPFKEAMQTMAALWAIAAQLLAWALAVALSGLLVAKGGGRSPSRASFIQAAVHGNQAYIGLAVIYYALGEAGLHAAALAAALVIIVQNLLGVLSLHFWGAEGRRMGPTLWAVAKNPIILSSALGLVWSLLAWPLPPVLDGTLNIISGMGLPLALLIVGAQLTQGMLTAGWRPLAAMAGIKLLIMPALGFAILWLLHEPGLPTTVTVILLAAPTATISVIMARQLGGDPELASQCVTLTHGLSALSYSLWLLLLVPAA